MDVYFIAKFLHIISATVLFGTGLGTAFAMWMANRNGDPVVIAGVVRNVVIADWVFTAPAVIIQPLTGAWLIYEVGYQWEETWLMIAVFLYILAGACWLPVVLIQTRLRGIAEQAVREGQNLPNSYHRLFRIWFLLGWPAFAAILGIFWLMIWRP